METVNVDLSVKENEKLKVEKPTKTTESRVVKIDKALKLTLTNVSTVKNN